MKGSVTGTTYAYESVQSWKDRWYTTGTTDEYVLYINNLPNTGFHEIGEQLGYVDGNGVLSLDSTGTYSIELRGVS